MGIEPLAFRDARGWTRMSKLTVPSCSSRETIRRLQRIIESAHGSLLGVVATGVEAGPDYDHYSPKSYTHNGAHGSGKGRWLRRPAKANGTFSSDEEPVLTPPDQTAQP